MSAPLEASATPKRHPPRRSGVVVPHQATAGQRLAATLVSCTIEVVGASLRWQLHDLGNAREVARDRRCIFAIWHNRLALCLLVYRRYFRPLQPQRRMAAMVSASRDGALLARVLEWFEVEPVRGSTSRRGPQALRELVSWAEQGLDLAITPDGPRGPCYEVQDGVIALAQLTGMPLLPVNYRLHGKVRARSWDRFQIPLPFGRVEVYFGKPFFVPRRLNAAEREFWRREFEAELRRTTWD